MRQVVLDTETTGLHVKSGHRIIEVGCVELVNRRLTGRYLHHYVNPERLSDPDAINVHGITDAFLVDKPKFAEIAQALRQYCEGAEIIIHNAPFDVGFLNEEYRRLGMPEFDAWVQVITDTLALSKRLNPGKRQNLDALCDRYGVNRAHRTVHGALLDAQLLAEVYLAMTRGQDVLAMVGEPAPAALEEVSLSMSADLTVPALCATQDELVLHEAYLDKLSDEIKAPPFWRR